MNFLGYPFHQNSQEEYTSKTGIARYLEVLWDNLGKLLGMNLLCFAAFLPLAMGISLGLTFENFWLTMLGGLLGGCLACPFWVASQSIAICCFLDIPVSWFSHWMQHIKRCWKKAAWEGSILGTAAGCLLAAGQFLSGLVEQGNLPAPVVWIGLCFDALMLAMLSVLLELPLSISNNPIKQRLQEGISHIAASPGRMLAGTVGVLLWCMLGIGLFPVSVPFAAVVGFWPLLLLLAQLHLPLLDFTSLEESAMEAESERTPGMPKRKNLGLLLVIMIIVSIVLGGVRFFSAYREPDLQIAVVHSESLPDSVTSALESSLEELVGDRNGDGAIQVIVNDYVLVFDGSATDMDIQTAGMTRLVTDLNAGDSCIFIVEDSNGFLSVYADLMDTAKQKQWSQFPVLSGLDAGIYSSLDNIQNDLKGQALLQNYFVIPAMECPHDLISLLLK